MLKKVFLQEKQKEHQADESEVEEVLWNLQNRRSQARLLTLTLIYIELFYYKENKKQGYYTIVDVMSQQIVVEEVLWNL